MSESYHNVIMSDRFERTATFSNWPINAPISALRMVDAGFYLNSQTSKVNCFSCGFEISTMLELQELIDNERKIKDGTGLLLKMHNRQRPDCAFVKDELRKLGQEVLDYSGRNTNVLSNVIKEPEVLSDLNEKIGQLYNQNGIDKINVSAKNGDSEIPARDNINGAYMSQNNYVAPESGYDSALPASLLYLRDSEINKTHDSLFGPSISRPGISLFQNNHASPLNNLESIAGSLPSIQTENGPIGALSSVLYEEKYDYSLKHPQYNTVTARVESFKNWPYNDQQHYRNLIPAGFFYTGNSDIVRCFCCDIGLAEWDPGDDPWEEHARHSPNCKYLKEKKGESYINKIQAEWRKIYNPKHEAYSDQQTRIDSYQGWPDDLEQRPNELATAGFFYSGEGDVVRCHYCDGGLREWEPGDDPWTEHAKWFPFCKYIMKVKGIGFIEDVARQHEAETLANESEENSRPSNANIHLSEEADKVISMGYTRDSIQFVVNEFTSRNGHSNYSAQELMQIIMEYEDRGETIPSQPPASAPPRAPRSIDNTPSNALADVLNIANEEEKLDPQTIAKENKELKNKLICIKCNSKDRNMVFIPCGHRLMCESCSEGEKRCRKCKKIIKKKVKTFLV